MTNDWSTPWKKTGRKILIFIPKNHDENLNREWRTDEKMEGLDGIIPWGFKKSFP